MTTKAAVAYHEAGHAVMASHCKIGFAEVSIAPGEGFEGRCKMMKQASLLRADYELPPELQRRLHKMIMVALAGGVAERLYSRKSDTSGSSRNDNAVARFLAGKSAGDTEEEDALLNYLKIYTRNFLKNSNWDAVKALAKELLEKKSVSGQRARKIIQSA